LGHKKCVLNLSWKIPRKRPTGKLRCVNTVNFGVHKRQRFIDQPNCSMETAVCILGLVSNKKLISFCNIVAAVYGCRYLSVKLKQVQENGKPYEVCH
jgi:hypothetical protein